MRNAQSITAFALALSAILLEVAVSSGLSATTRYFVAHAMTSIGVLGIGLGAVLSLQRGWFDSVPPGRLVAVAAIFGSSLVLATYFLLPSFGSGGRYHIDDVGDFVVALVPGLLLGLPFAAIGVAWSTVLAQAKERIGVAFAASLSGAAVAFFGSSWMSNATRAGRALFVAGAFLAIAAFVSESSRRLRTAAGAIVLVCTVAALSPSWWRVVFAAQSVDAQGSTLLPGAMGEPLDSQRQRDANQSIALASAVLGRSELRVLVLGSASSDEIVEFARHGATTITLFSSDPTNAIGLKGEVRAALGDQALAPEIILSTDPPRNYLARSGPTFDIIWFSIPEFDSGARGVGPGAFVFDESYVYTVEALRQARRRLRDDGLLCAQLRRPSPGDFADIVRFLSTARHADYRSHIADLPERALVFSAGRRTATAVLPNRPLDEAQINAFSQHARAIPGLRLWYMPRRRVAPTPVVAILKLPQESLGEWELSAGHVAHPVLDDSPFFWHSRRFGDSWEQGAGLPTAASASPENERSILLTLAIALAACFVGARLPFRDGRRGSWGKDQAVWSGGLVAVGVATAFYQTGVVQAFSPVFGSSARSFALAFALFSSWGAVGAFVSGRLAKSGPRLGLLFSAMVVATSFFLFWMPRFASPLGVQPLALRVAAAVCIIAPVGATVGALFPCYVSALSRNLTDESWVVVWAFCMFCLAAICGYNAAFVLALLVGYKLLLIAAPVLVAAGLVALFSHGAFDAGARQEED